MSKGFGVVHNFEQEHPVRHKGNHSGAATGPAVTAASKLQPLRNPTSADAEVSKVVQRLFLTPEFPSPQVTCFTPVDQDCNSAALCTRTAEVLLSRIPVNVCLLNADLRSDLREYLTTELAERGELRIPVAPSVTASELCPGLYYAESREVEGTITGIITDLRNTFEYVFVNLGSALSNGTDLSMAGAADATILVAEAGKTRNRNITSAKEHLESAGAKIAGAVLNNRRFPVPDKIYRYL